jgi:hypothetical protein
MSSIRSSQRLRRAAAALAVLLSPATGAVVQAEGPPPGNYDPGFKEVGELPLGAFLSQTPPAGVLSDPPRKLQTASAGDLGTLTSKVDLSLTDLDAAAAGPARQQAWKVDDSWRCPVAGPFSFYGQFGGNSAEKLQDDMKVNGRTELACKLSLFEAGEVELRSGPSLSYTDPLRPSSVKEKSEWLLELQGRWPLFAGVGLEYQGSLSPALTPTDKNRLSNDLRLAAPLGGAGKIQFGARHSWEGLTTDPRPTVDSMQFYLGVELAH